VNIALNLSNAANASGVYESLSPGAGDNTLQHVRATIDTSLATGLVWLQLFEGTASPTSLDVPVASVPFDAAGHAQMAFGATGRLCAGACALALSSAATAFSTAPKSGGGDLQALFDIQYF
jgi:hypothetical protein